VHDDVVLERLRRGDEEAFRELVARHHAQMVRVAAWYVPSRAIAEEVAQETWLAVVEGLDRFEGRSSVRTWIFRILVNRARTKGVREHRSVPLSALSTLADDDGEPSVPAGRFLESGHRWAGHWAEPPPPWAGLPEDRVVIQETTAVIEAALRVLPPRQRDVVTLRDVSGWTADEVCDVLAVSAGNQRVLLHRGRSKIRAAVEDHLREPVTP
jgi:RNA polymerase sigma-70 factor (ECF subfamily)